MARLARLFAPKDRGFFDLFEAAGANIIRTTELLVRMLADWPDNRDLLREITDCEHEGDRITQHIKQRLNTKLATPIAREDIFALASGLDDIVDYAEEAADHMVLYRIEAPMEQAQTLAAILAEAARATAEAIPRMRTFSDVQSCTDEVGRLEHEGDKVVREAIASLFESGIDPMMVIRWKDIFERLEDALDATETAAHILEGIVVKNR
jgi:uncharacterized protein